MTPEQIPELRALRRYMPRLHAAQRRYDESVVAGDSVGARLALGSLLRVAGEVFDQLSLKGLTGEVPGLSRALGAVCDELIDALGKLDSGRLDDPLRDRAVALRLRIADGC